MKFIKTILAGAVVLLMVPANAFGAQAVDVALPTFAVTINGIETDSANSQYPFLVYKDITYVPMTYNDARLLGLNSAWSEQNGLRIDKIPTFDAQSAAQHYQPYKAANPNDSTGKAVLAEFAVTVGGEAIDNLSEEYPLLVYRDVTYFPLTWRFAVEKFGWKYNFDAQSGLVIAPVSTALPPMEAKKIIVTGNVVNVRSGFSTDFDVIAKVKSGDVLTALGMANEWYQVVLSDGQVGWIAGYLAEEVVANDTGNNDDTGNTNGSDNAHTNNTTNTTDVTVTPESSGGVDSDTSDNDAILLDSEHQVNVKQVGIDTIVDITGVKNGGYTMAKANNTTLVLTINNGNFKPQTYQINKDGINFIKASGQLVNINFTGEIAYATKYQMESNSLQLIVKNMGNKDNTPVISAPATENPLKIAMMSPAEAKTTIELVIGADNGAKTISSANNQVVVEIENNSLSQFSDKTFNIGPLKSISTKKNGDKAELTLSLQDGAYCAFDRIGDNLAITVKSRNSNQSQGLNGKTIVLDPGHGGNDPGAIGLVLGITDREVGMGICNSLKPLLEAQGATVIMTRQDQYGFLTVSERAELSNDVDADIFVSVHANSAAPKTGPYGTQVYYYAPNDWLTITAQKPIRIELAQKVSDAISAQTGRKSGIYTSNLGVLRGNKAPSILVEAGFLSNREEEALMSDQAYLDKIALGIFNGLVDYLNI